ncbi:MAG: NAD-dependent epimerase/dehydratase [Acidobacteriales bacterium]|nr:NAD-dependent epimerase/dehydratase [Terriglobales bacterium]
MARYLITGIAGFIGSSLAHGLLTRGDSVRGIDNFATGKRENLSDIAKQIDFREVDLLDEAALSDACRDVDIIFHEAAIPSVPKSVVDPVTSHRANINGTLNLLVAARDAKVKRVVYAASSSAYGETPVLPKHEGMPSDPISPYAVQKLCGEQYMKSFYRVYGLETVSLRYFNVFGPHQDPTSQYSGVLAKFCSAMLRGDSPTIYGDGEQSRDFTYIDNVVAGNILAATAPASQVAGKCMNLATGKRITLNQIVEILRDLTGYKGEVTYAPERTGDIKHSLADISLAQKAMNYTPHVNFEDGLKKTVAWYRTVSSTVATAR